MNAADFTATFRADLEAAVMAREGKQERGEVRFRCPSPEHEDRHPSARLNREKAAWCCDGCGAGGGAFDLADRLGVEKPHRQGEGEGIKASVTGATMQPGVTIAALAEAKRLHPEQLQSEFGLYNLPNYNGAKAVGIPYLDAAGELAATRFRIALAGDRFRWKKGSTPTLYGRSRLAEIRTAGWVLIVEGESDCWTAWHHGLPALGVPGKSLWKPEWTPYFDGLDVYLWQEPDAEDFVARVGAHLPTLKVIAAPGDAKDLNAAHVAGQDVPALIERLKGVAYPVADVLDQQRRERLAELRRAAEPILAAEDPLKLAENGMQALGYGGDLKPAVITYLAATTRLLAVRPGVMLAHLLLIGPASAGKSFTVSVVLRLLPDSAYAVIDAGSPRVLIYDKADYQHRALVFGEADSIPAGEDNPAASAIRNLLQDNRLHYKATVKDPDTGGFTTQTVEKPGPTVMLTTSTRSLGHQLSTRLFALDVADDANQMRAALAAQAALEEDGASDADAALIAFQDYLQAHAPWDVVVPFAKRLGELIGQTHTANRVLRDFQRLLSLTKAVAILRHQHRQRDATGRLIATTGDYGTVRELVNHLYAATVAGGSQAVRDTVAAVRELTATTETPSALDVATKLDIHKATATRRINKAIVEGWLINEEEKKHRPYRLKLGDPMPEAIGLPTPDALTGDGCMVAGMTDGRGTSPPPSDAGDDTTRTEPQPSPPLPSPNGTKPPHAGQRCVHCGESVTVPGQLYCERHGGRSQDAVQVSNDIPEDDRELEDMVLMILGLSPAELDQYRAELAAAPADDPDLPREHEALRQAQVWLRNAGKEPMMLLELHCRRCGKAYVVDRRDLIGGAWRFCPACRDRPIPEPAPALEPEAAA